MTEAIVSVEKDHFPLILSVLIHQDTLWLPLSQGIPEKGGVKNPPEGHFLLSPTLPPSLAHTPRAHPFHYHITTSLPCLFPSTSRRWFLPTKAEDQNPFQHKSLFTENCKELVPQL